MDVIGPLFLLELVLVVNQFVRGSDDVFLPFQERLHRLILTAATAATALLSLTVFASERPHFDEVNVGGNDVRRSLRIHGFTVISDQIAGLQIVLFKEKGMTGRN